MKVASVEKLEALKAAAEAIAAESEGHIEDIFETTGDYIEGLAREHELTFAEIGGEWAVIGLARAGRTVPGKVDYLENVEAYVEANIDENERLHPSKSTDNSRLIVALTALGEDVTNVAGHNLLQGLDSMEYLKKQGINGPIWALIALDCHNYDLPEGADYNRYDLVNYILDCQLEDGGWALAGTKADPDMTGMALQALAPYYDKSPEVKAAVDKAVGLLSEMQSSVGGFGSIDGASVESVAQVVVALTALGIDPMTDERFIKNDISAIDNLCSFYVEGGGFRHIPTGSLDGMATEQGYYALAAWFRLINGQTALYDMTDVDIVKTADDVSEMIEALPDPEEVTLEDEDAIEEARDAYDKLSDEEKEKVPSELVEKLEADEEKLSELKAEKAEELISAIPDTVKLSDEDAIKAAREYFDELSDEEKAMVDEALVAKLEKAEKDLQALKDAQGSQGGGTPSGGTVVPGGETAYQVSEATKEADKAMKDIIDATPEDKTEFTDEEIQAIIDAYEKYEALSPDEKLFAKNYKEFEEKVLSKLADDLHYDEPTETDARDNAEDVLPWHVKLNVSEAELTDEQIAAIKEVLGEDADLGSVRAISYTDILTGKDFVPRGSIKIMVPADGIEEGKTVVFVRVKEDGSFEYIQGKVSKGVLTVLTDKTGPMAAFGSSLSWEEIFNGKQDVEPAKKSRIWLYVAGGAAVLLIGALILGKRKKDEDED